MIGPVRFLAALSVLILVIVGASMIVSGAPTIPIDFPSLSNSAATEVSDRLPDASAEETEVATQEPLLLPTAEPDNAIEPVATEPPNAEEPLATDVPDVKEPAATEIPVVEEPTEEPALEPTPEDGSGDAPGDGIVVIERGDTSRMEIALTFDAGADRGYAERILNTLYEAGVTATFGMTGFWAEENPDLLQRMVDEGHQIINHAYSHRSFTGSSTSDWDPGILTSAERASEVSHTNDIISSLTGYDTQPYFRPPYGDYDSGVLADLEGNGYTIVVMWSCDTLGWNGLAADEIIYRCGTDMVPGDIILLHVGAESADAEALPGLIEKLRSEGFTFVSIEQMLG